MNGEDFRSALLRKVSTQFSGRTDVRILYENGQDKVDFDLDKRPIVGVEVVFSSARQADLSNRPWVVETGVVLFSVIILRNTGTKLKTALVEELQDAFELSELAGATLGVGSQLAAADSEDGWVSYRLAINFELHRLKK